jgi:hypothetical protein
VTVYPPCIGCGYCCHQGICFVAKEQLGYHKGPCKALVWDGERHWCGLVLKDSSLKRPLAIGEGCSSNLNSWRREPLRDRTAELRDGGPCPSCGTTMDDHGDGVVTCGRCGEGMGR